MSTPAGAPRRLASVLGYDRMLRTSRLDLVKRALDAEFDLIGDMALPDLARGDDRGRP